MAVSRRSIATLSMTLLAVLSAAAAADLVANGRNTLARKPNLASVKVLMGRGVLGSESFVATRNALAHQTLDLGAWHGGQEVVFWESMNPGAIKGRVRLGDRVWATIAFDRGPDGYSGVRLSRSDSFPAQGFEADREGRFTRRYTLADGELTAGWHQFEVILNENVIVRLDGREIGRWHRERTSPGLVGFRAGLMGAAEFDDLRVLDPNGRLLAHETFDNWVEFAPLFAGFVALFLLMGVGALRLPNILPVVVASLLATVALGMLDLFDRFYWANRYPYQELAGSARSPQGPWVTRPQALAMARFAERQRARLLGAYPVPLERLRIEDLGRPPSAELRGWLTRANPEGDPEPVLALGFRRRFLPVVSPSVEDRVAMLPSHDGRFRLAWIGTSQTYGVGAETPAETFVARVQMGLATDLGSGRVESLNLAIGGSNSNVLTEALLGSLVRLRPDLLVINLGNNDRSVEALGVNVEKLVAETQRLGGTAALVLEANIERPSGRLLSAHAALRAVGKRTGVPVIDLHGYLQSPAVVDSGFLAWDHVHLTSLGQELAAGYLLESLRPMVRERLSQPVTPSGDAMPPI